MPRGVSEARGLARKARAAAQEAVAIYNNPMTSFKSGAYIILMHVAWTALLLAVFRKQGIKPYYRKQGSNRFERIDGRPKVWELAECLRQYWGNQNDAVKENLRFFIGLRNLIEHADVPQVDLNIYGECQALLHNFEDILDREFGARFAIRDSLAISLQFSRVQTVESQSALQSLLRPMPKDIKNYVDQFRSSLTPDILNEMCFSYKVFLIPMIGNHRAKDALPIEFVPYDPSNPQHDRMVGLIKQRFVEARNVGVMKPKRVTERVASAIAPLHFNMNMHTLAWKHWKVRPPSGVANPAACQTKYCQYDVLNRDYVYTEEWVSFLVSELTDEQTYYRVCGIKNPIASFS